MRTPRLTSFFLFIVGALLAGTLAACSPGSAQPSGEQEQAQELPAVTVYKSPTCGCCSLWVDHLRENGFEAKTIDMPDVRPMKEQFGLPADLASCHTAVVDGYVIEGHVPASDVKKPPRRAPRRNRPRRPRHADWVAGHGGGRTSGRGLRRDRLYQRGRADRFRQPLG